MPSMERIYRRTAAGLNALQSQDAGLPAEYRRILSLIETETHSELVRSSLRRYSEEQVFDWLDQLQALGFIEAEPVTSKHDLDFTGSLNLAAMFAKHKAA